MSGELQTTEQREHLPADPRADLWAQAKAMAGSALVPQNFRNQPADCFIMADLALRLGVPLLPLLQETYVVHGKPAFSGKMAAALLEGSGRIKGPIDYVFFGTEGQDDYGCRCVVYDKALDKVIEGPRVTWAMVRAEKWDSNSKWKNLPDLMFRYRAASFLVRTQYSSLLMGMAMEDEVIDVQATPVEAPPATSKADLIASQLDAGDGPSTSGEAVEEPEPSAATFRHWKNRGH